MNTWDIKQSKKYAKSPHGKLSCRQCHTTVWKIPHVGEMNVDCTTQCHKEDAEKILIDKESFHSFHKKEQSYIIKLKDKSSCRVCHPLYPHYEDEVVRTLLNMHTGFMLCEVCHIKKARFNQLTYEWHETENATFRGDPYVSYYDPHTKKAQKSKKITARIAALKKAHKDRHFITRIAAFTGKNGKRLPLMNTWDIKQSKKYLKKEASLNADEKKEKLEFFHRDIEKKELSVACEVCHSSQSILDFEMLGFDKKKTSNLLNMNIKGLVTKYKSFYFPTLFKEFDCK